jgi:hypothetical protein
VPSGEAESLREDLSLSGPRLVVIGAGFVGGKVVPSDGRSALDVTHCPTHSLAYKSKHREATCSE